jgi:hypothetical protein
MRLIFFFFLLAKVCYSQNDTISLNNLNTEGKKHGYWKTFLDSSFKEVDSVKAQYYYYYYHNGKRLNGVWKGKGWNVEKFDLEVKGNNNVADGPTILDGSYLFRKKSDTAFYVQAVFDNGYNKLLIEQFQNSKIRRHYQKMDFSKKYKNYVASCYIENMTDYGHFEKGYCYCLPNSTKIKYDLKKHKTD